MSSPAIEVRDVAKSFRIPSIRRETVREHLFGLLQPRSFETLDVLRGVSFSLQRGETLGLMGRNGSGKSTLLKIVCGIYGADAGAVAVGGRVTPVLELGIGWNAELNAIDNILLIGTVMGMTLSEARASIDAVLAFAGLQRFAELELKHYSSGMASRLAYAVAFHAPGEILVLDEIFAVGDAEFRSRCESRYRELAAAGHSVLLVSHDARFIRTFCSRALLLEGGRVVLEDTGERVVEAYLRMLQG